ncbi:MAG TPA: ABC transporter ATP-binding protein [Candidatus Hydrogenedentes bacterium]|nr:ABC transporter ATP-binding protein [Candidatus Hydrogenedentota bacterium]HOL77184.1 ABC transporter ATP-binding protein [Candidatus Hydrogenedentota bacterium]HPO85877.1 ABC transporter ATP-binding protein [Candidatus Hydrogenedentota bacterium]
MIETQGLTKYYGRIPAIQDVTFQIEKGEVVGFLGPNAAGKSTTLRILAGCMPPSSGTARIAGFSVTDNSLEAKRNLGYLPENISIYPEMTVQGFLKYVADIKGVARGEVSREIGRVMERCGLTHMSRRQVGHLSKGYRQRVGLAQALIGNPAVLILDEPTVGLDPRQIIEIREMIRSLADSHTILLSSHILPEVSMVCRRVIIIHQGRIVTQDAMSVLEKSAERVTVWVEAIGSEQTIRNILQGVPGVDLVQLRGGSESTGYRFEVTGLRGHVTPNQIADKLVRAGVAVVALQERSRTLEDIFVEAIATEESLSGSTEQEP